MLCFSCSDQDRSVFLLAETAGMTYFYWLNIVKLNMSIILDSSYYCFVKMLANFVTFFNSNNVVTTQRLFVDVMQHCVNYYNNNCQLQTKQCLEIENQKGICKIQA